MGSLSTASPSSTHRPDRRIRTLHDARAVAHSMLRVTGLLDRRDHPKIARLVCQRWRWGHGESDERGVLVATFQSATSVAMHGVVRGRPIVYVHRDLDERAQNFAVAVALGFVFLARTRFPLSPHNVTWATTFAEELTGIREQDVLGASHPIARRACNVSNALEHLLVPLRALDRFAVVARLYEARFVPETLRDELAAMLETESIPEVRDRATAVLTALGDIDGQERGRAA